MRQSGDLNRTIVRCLPAQVRLLRGLLQELAPRKRAGAHQEEAKSGYKTGERQNENPAAENRDLKAL
jgi:hypothetical protein